MKYFFLCFLFLFLFSCASNDRVFQLHLILDEIKLVNKIVPINNLDFSSIAKKYKVVIWVDGDDWNKCQVRV